MLTRYLNTSISRSFFLPITNLNTRVKGKKVEQKPNSIEKLSLHLDTV